MKLTSKERGALPDKAFALPGRRYPIHNIDHARVALSMVAKNGTPDEQSQVKSAVKARFPQIDDEGQADKPGVEEQQESAPKMMGPRYQFVKQGKR